MRASLLTQFLLPDINIRLRPKILGLRPGTRVATNTFDFGDWEADEKFEVPPPECMAHCWALCWMVPAKVAGVWHMDNGTLHFEQIFQMISGTLTLNGVLSTVSHGRLRGDLITFTAGGGTFSGQVRGDVIEGVGVCGATGGTWRAIRS